MQYNFEVHDYNTGNRNNMRLPRMKTDLQKRSAFFEGFIMFNELPAELKQCQNEDIIKDAL